MPDNTTTGLIAVLAAGRGTRFGADKLATPCAGRPLGQWAQAAALGAGLPVVCVVGPHSALPCLAGVERMVNPLADEGLGTSLALAARVAMARGAPCLLVMLPPAPVCRRCLGLPCCRNWRSLLAHVAPQACWRASRPTAAFPHPIC
jgi:CTP:molybdopterin cytidylyltransferase MocA